jgi:hypothetical protein
MLELVTHRTANIHAPAHVVWELIADFGSLGEWWPTGLLERVETQGVGVGMVRSLHTVIGIVLHERLEALYPDELRLELAITGDLPVGMTDYHAVGQVTATDVGTCTIDWTGHYKVPQREAESGARDFVEGAYALMFKGIKDHVAQLEQP